MNLVQVFASLLIAAVAAFAQKNDGYIGIYGDPAGASPCMTLAQGTGTTLYLLAKTAGATSAGITGAKFRIEMSNPEGWFLAYNAPQGATTFGNILDTSPADSTDGSGIDIVFANCQAPVGGKVGVGTINVFNMSGAAATLSVKRHSNPKNTNYQCPLFILCDNPTFTRSCMGQSSEQSCLTLKAGRARGTVADPIVFDATLNRPQPDSSQPVPFVETISLGNTELWVAGHRISGVETVIRFDGSTLSIGDIVVPLELPERQLSDAQLTRSYGRAPRFQALMAGGMTPSQAIARFQGEVDSLNATGYVALIQNGMTSACDTFRASPLIENAECAGSTVRYELHGILGRRVVNLTAKLPEGARPMAHHQRVKELVDGMKNHLSLQWDEGAVLVVDRGGGMQFVGGPESVRAKAQLNYLVSGGSLGTMPKGPFYPRDPMLQEIIAIARGKQ